MIIVNIMNKNCLFCFSSWNKIFYYLYDWTSLWSKIILILNRLEAVDISKSPAQFPFLEIASIYSSNLLIFSSLVSLFSSGKKGINSSLFDLIHS